MRKSLLEILRTMDYSSIRAFLVEYVSKEGWKRLWTELRSALNSYYGNKWFSIRRVLLHIFDAYHLRGYDGNIPQLLDTIKNLCNLDEIAAMFDKSIHDAIRMQFKENRSTRLFSLAELKESRSSFLIKDVVSARRRAFLKCLQAFAGEGGFDGEEFEISIKGLMSCDYGKKFVLSLINDNKTTLYGDEKKAFSKKLLEFAEELDFDRTQFINCPRLPEGSRITPKNKHFAELCKLLDTIHFSYRNPPYQEIAKTGFFDPLNVISEYLKPQSDEFYGRYHLPDVGEVGYHHMQSAIVPVSLEEIAQSAVSNRTRLLLDALQLDLEIDSPNGPDYSIHDVVFTALKEWNDVDVDFVVDWINNIHWDSEAWGCSELNVWMNTSFVALEAAVEIAVNHNRKEIIPKLEGFLELLRWASPWELPYGLPGMAIQALVRFKGIEMFDDLVERLSWFHRKWDCGTMIDSRVVEGIVSIGRDVIPKLKKHLYEEWGLNKGAIAVLEGLGEDPGDYYSVCDPDNHISWWREIILLKANTDRRKAIDEIMRCMYITGFSENYVARKKWIRDLKLALDEKDILLAIRSSNKEISQGACVLAEIFPSKRINAEILKRANSTRTHAQAILYSLRQKMPLDIRRVFRWVASRFMREGFDWGGTEESHSYIREVLSSIRRRLISNRLEIEALESFLKSKLWKRCAAAIAILFEVISEENGREILIKSGFSDFANGFAFATKREQSKYAYYGRRLANEEFAQIVIESAMHRSPNSVSKLLTHKQLVKSIKTSKNPVPLFSYILKCPYYKEILLESYFGMDVSVGLLQSVEITWDFVNFANFMHDLTPKSRRNEFVCNIGNMISMDFEHWTLVRIAEVLPHLVFRKELITELFPKNQLAKAKEQPVSFVVLISKLSEIESFPSNPWLKEKIDDFVRELPSIISGIEWEHTLDSLRREVESCKYLEVPEEILIQIDDRLKLLHNEKVRQFPRYSPRNKPAVSKSEPSIQDHIDGIIASLENESSWSPTNKVEQIVRTEEVDAMNRLNSALADHLETHKLSINTIHAVAAIPAQKRSNRIVEIMLERIDEICSLFAHTNQWEYLVTCISDFKTLLENPKIAEAMFKRIINAENPLNTFTAFTASFMETSR